MRCQNLAIQIRKYDFYTIENNNKIQNLPLLFMQSMLQGIFFNNSKAVCTVPK